MSRATPVVAGRSYIMSVMANGKATERAGLSGRVRVAAGLAVVALAWIAVAVGLRVAHAGEVLPGTRVGGISLGRASPDEARRRLASISAENPAVRVVQGARRFTVRARDVGLRVDVAATVSRAMRAGRRGPLAGLGSAVTALVVARDMDAVYVADRRRLAETVATIAQGIDRPTFRGRLAIDPITLRVAVVPPSRGRVIDRRATAAAILAGLRGGGGAVVSPKTWASSVPALRDVEAVARRARMYLAAPLRLSGAGEELSVPPRRLAAILDVRPIEGAGAARVRLGARPERLSALVAALAARRDRPARDARIIAPAAPVTVEEKGDMSWRPRRARVRIERDRPGRRLQRSGAADAIDAAVRDNRHTAVLPVGSAPADVPADVARRVRRLIGAFTTRFECCQPRVTNIRLIARAVDRTVIAPRAQFSLNAVAGRRTRAGGYVPAPFISDGKLVPSVGGGVSQFSTTMYNAAYFAGLKIDYHQPHSAYIARYPAGREATLDYGSIDLTWTNDTAVAVLVRSSSTPTSVTVSLYGDNGGRRVRAKSGPRQALPGRDFAITVTRRIRYADGRVVRQPYTTSYDKPPLAE